MTTKWCPRQNDVKPTIGLIAGRGKLPILEAQGIRAKGCSVAAIGLIGQYDDHLKLYCDRFATSGLIRIGRWIRLFRKWGVHQVVMVGSVKKNRIYEPLLFVRQIPDWHAAKLWFRVLRQDKRDQSLLHAVAEELKQNGIELIDTTRYIPEHLADQGVLTRRKPSAREMADIQFGWPLLLQITELDIGQSIAVKQNDIIAVEAMEGTDAMIQRAAGLCRTGGWVMLKGVKNEKDMRFDVPTVGVHTIENLKKSNASCMVVAAKRVILVDKPLVIQAADQADITIVGVDQNGQW